MTKSASLFGVPHTTYTKYDELKVNLPFNKSHFIELMYWATRSVEFSFNDIMYKQVDGVAMGSPLGPILANIFVGYYERTLFNQVTPPLCYYRYVDDTFAIFPSNEDFNHFLLLLNKLHPSLTFTSEVEVDNKLPFLDVLVEKTGTCFLTSVYRKPTFSGLYTRWESFCPESRKLSLIGTLTHRALKICSPCKLAGELQFLEQVFLKNGYPQYIIKSTMNRKVASFNDPLPFGPKKCPVYLRIPWKGNISKLWDKQVRAAISKCYNAALPRVVFITKPLLPSSNKDVLPTLSRSNVIYKYSCRCDAAYVGRTSQRLGDRAKQHAPPTLVHPKLPTRAPSSRLRTYSSAPNGVQNLDTQSGSAIHQHLLENSDCLRDFTYDRFTILSPARSAFHLSVLEALFIKALNPVLCRQKEFVYSLKLFT